MTEKFDIANIFSDKLEEEQLNTKEKATIFLYLFILEYRRYGQSHFHEIIIAMFDELIQEKIGEQNEL